MADFKKGMGPTKKNVFKNKIETNVLNKFFFFGGAHEFYFTNMKTVCKSVY